MSQNLNTIIESIIGCAYTVGNRLGHGFIEEVYENALSHELQPSGWYILASKTITCHCKATCPRKNPNSQSGSVYHPSF